MIRAHARNVRVLTKSRSRNVAKLLPAQSSLRKSPVAAVLLGWLAASVFAESPAAAQDELQGIAGNPGAVDVEPGTGELRRVIGFGPDSGVRLGGVLEGRFAAARETVEAEVEDHPVQPRREAGDTGAPRRGAGPDPREGLL